MRLRGCAVSPEPSLLAYAISTKNMQHDFFVFLVWFDSLRPSQQFFSHVGTGLPGLNQYQAEDNVSCSRTH